MSMLTKVTSTSLCFPPRSRTASGRFRKDCGNPNPPKDELISSAWSASKVKIPTTRSLSESCLPESPDDVRLVCSRVVMVVAVLAVVVAASGGENEEAIPRKEKDPLRDTLTVEDIKPLSFLRCPIARKLPFSSISTVTKQPKSVLSSLLIFTSQRPKIEEMEIPIGMRTGR